MLLLTREGLGIRHGGRHYENGKSDSDSDMDLRDAIQRVALEWPSYGRRMRAVRASGGVSGRWSAGGDSVFVLRQVGDVVTGQIEVRAGEPVYEIVDRVARDGRIHFFVLHDAADDPEVKANGGNPFHNVATGTFTENQIDISGSRENTNIREYHVVLTRIRDK